MAILSNIHSHTTFSDGKNTPEEMVIEAINKGFVSLGFSDHGFTFYDTSYCMPKEKTADYFAEIKSLKEKYKDKIDIYLGIESDYYDPFPKDGLDFTIGAVHYIKDEKTGNYLAVDHLENDMERLVSEVFNGDEKAFVKKYYDRLTDKAFSYKPDIIAHPDLIVKLNKDGKYFDEESDWYKKIIRDTALKLAESGCIVEMNTGVIFRGYRSEPYPSSYFLKELEKLSVPMILSSDAHGKEALDVHFKESVDILLDAGYKTIKQLVGGKFIDVDLL